MIGPISEFPVWRYQAGQEAAADKVTVEEPLEIRLHGEPFQVLMRLPGWEKELALATPEDTCFLLAEDVKEVKRL